MEPEYNLFSKKGIKILKKIIKPMKGKYLDNLAFEYGLERNIIFKFSFIKIKEGNKSFRKRIKGAINDN